MPLTLIKVTSHKNDHKTEIHVVPHVRVVPHEYVQLKEITKKRALTKGHTYHLKPHLQKKLK